jgi:hypothetical protein
MTDRLARREPDPTALLWKGKRACDLSHREAIECALHFHAAHLKNFAEACRMERRMRAIAEVFTEEQIQKLDRWLADHNDAAAELLKPTPGGAGSHHLSIPSERLRGPAHV